MNYRRLYIPNRIVFITVVTSKRREILINNIELLKYSFATAHKYYKFSIIAICVLKDHLHFLLQPQNIKVFVVAVNHRFTTTYKLILSLFL